MSSSRIKTVNASQKKYALRHGRRHGRFALCLTLLASSVMAVGYYAKRAAAESGAVTRPASRAGRAAQGVNLKAVPEDYGGPSKRAGQLSRHEARPLSLASADFDEDGVSDVVGGFEAAGGGGILTFNRGNLNAVYPNFPDAQRRGAEGSPDAAPFLSPGRAFDVTDAPAFLGAGDFDGDGHFDVVAARESAHSLYVLLGDGAGNFGSEQRLELPGALTALKAAEVNRADGLADIVAAVDGEEGAAVLVFEGPDGALRARPERIALPAHVDSLTVGQLDGESSFDLALAAGGELLFIAGRDRKLSLDEREQAGVAAPAVERRDFPSKLIAVEAGNFGVGDHQDLAALSEDGVLQILGRDEESTAGGAKSKAARGWRSEIVTSGSWSPSARLVVAGMSGGPSEDLLLLDPESSQLRVLKEAGRSVGTSATKGAAGGRRWDALALDTEAAPVAALPVHLDGDALKDLVLLRRDAGGLSVSTTAGTASAEFDASDAASPLEVKPWEETFGGGGARDLPFARQVEPRPTAAKAVRLADASKSSKSSAGGRLPAAQALCNSADPLPMGPIVSGVLAPPDCRYFFTGEFFDRYAFTGFAGQRIALWASSTVFDPALILYAPDGTRIFENDDSNDGTNPRIPDDSGYITLPVTGTYFIELTTIYFDETGPYNIRLFEQPPNECSETALASSDLFIGSLAISDLCGDGFGRRVDAFSFFGAAGQQVVVSMSSGNFDSLLELQRPNGLIMVDDNGGGLFDARIPPGSGALILPESGIYHIYATSALPNSLGLYSLRLTITGSTVVTNTNDSGDGSLRQAILNANAIPGPNTITFAIGSGAKTINLFAPLPPVAGPTLIDGTTQPGFAGKPIVELNGASAGIRAAGLKLTAGSSRVRGLVINRFAYGVAITNLGGNLVDGNYIGTNLAGTGALGNTRNGVVIFSSASNVIGGTTAAARNVISGNNGFGVEIGRNGSSGNAVGGNFIGTDATGAAALGNAGHGIMVRAGFNNLIGGAVAGARNVVAANAVAGIFLGDTLPSGNLIQGNFIGTNAAGTAALGNTDAGVLIGGVNFAGAPIQANNNLVGGTTAAARNVISGNNGEGVEINNAGSTGNRVQGNFVGTNAAGTAPLGNNGIGVLVTFAPDVVIGGAAAGAGNVISGNQGVFGYGLAIGIPRGGVAGGTGVTVQGNFIGTDATKTLHLGNAQDGIFIDAQSFTNTITGNAIAFNGGSGVYIPNNGPQPGVRILIELNHIFSNGDLGIDLGDRGITPNDPLDTDVGANLLQNFPTLKSVALSSVGGTPAATAKGGGESGAAAAVALSVNATLESTPNTTFTIHWQLTADQQCSPKNQPVSDPVLLQKIPGVVTNANGIANFTITFTFPGAMDKGVIYANAIDPNGNTSENSQCLPVSSTPSPSGTLQLNNSAYSVNEGAGPLVVVVTRANGTTGAVSVNYSTSPGTAAAGSDYTPTAGTLSFADGVASKSISVPIVNDTTDEADETFTLTLSAAAGGAALGSPNTATVTIFNDDKPTFEFESEAYGVGEAAGVVTARVVRRGDPAPAAAVEYATSDSTATERRDYSLALGRLDFAPGETAKPVSVLVADDAYVEPAESFFITLSKPSAGAALGARLVATVTITSNDTAVTANPIDSSEFYVKQQYADFLNRAPDERGLAFWKDQTDKRTAPCAALADAGDRARCALQARANISAGFFLSIEFQQVGYLVHRFYTEAYGRAPQLREFMTDAQEMGRGVVVGMTGWEATLAANQRDFTSRFVQRPEFVQRFGAMTNADYVNALFSNAGVGAGVDADLRQALVNGLANQTETRATVLRKVADSRSVYNQQYNPAFVLMQYFGYLRRNPNDLPDTDLTGYNFWLRKMNDFTQAGEDASDEGTALGRVRRAQMVEAFVDATEYRTRFAP